MSEKTSEEHWKDKCARYLDSIVPAPSRAPKPPLPQEAPITPPVYGQIPYRHRPEKRDKATAAHGDEPALQDGARRRLLLSSAHGVPFMAHARSKRGRAAWFAVIACSVLAAICIVAYVGWKYATAAPVLRVRYRKQCCRQFPAVTICNNNLLRRSRLGGSRFANLSRVYIRRGNSQSAEDGYIVPPMDKFSKLSEFMRGKGVELNEKFLREIDRLNSVHNHVNHDDDWQQIYEHAGINDQLDLRLLLHPSKMELENLGHKESSLIMQCTIDGRPCNTRLRVGELSHPLHGNCFTVNLDRHRVVSPQTTHFGLGSGLRLILDAEVTEYVGLLTDIDGFRVFVHPRRDHFYHHDYVLVTPEHAAFLGVTQIVSTVNSGPCNSDVAYSIETCLEGCLNRLTKLYCGCSVLPFADKKARCNPFNQTQYICKEALSKLQSEDKFKCDCQRPCTFTDYPMKEYATTWPSSGHVSQLVAQLSRPSTGTDQTYIRDNVAMVNVFMSSSEYEERAEVYSYEWPSLLADVGGISALFVGVSILTLLEFGYVLCHAILCGRCGRQDRHQGHKNRVRYLQGFDAIPSDPLKSTAYTVNHHAMYRVPERKQHPPAPVRVAGLNDVYLPEGPSRPDANVHSRAAAMRAPPVKRQASVYRRAFRPMEQNRPYERVLVPVRYTTAAPPLNVPQRARTGYEPRRSGNRGSDGDARSDTLGYDLPRFRHLRPMAPVARKITM